MKDTRDNDQPRGGGITGELVRQLDWSVTSLGAMPG